jgi:hypothetical protein
MSWHKDDCGERYQRLRLGPALDGDAEEDAGLRRGGAWSSAVCKAGLTPARAPGIGGSGRKPSGPSPSARNARTFSRLVSAHAASTKEQARRTKAPH